MPLTAPLIVLGQLIGTAFAAGLNLYLTVALIGTSSRLGMLPSLPAGLKGLENPVLIGSAVALYLVEFIVDKVPHADSVWDALHTVIRPLGTAFLASLALDAAPLHWQVAAAVFAGGVSLAAHGTKAGLRIVLNRSPNRLRNSVLSTMEDMVAASLAVLALRDPVAALAFGGAALLVLIVFGPGYWRASALAVRAFAARVRGFFGSRGWLSTTEVPANLRGLIEPAPLGRAEPRVTRAALKGLPGVGAYRNGWLVVSYDRVSFVYRSFRGGRSRDLPPLDQPEVRRGLWTDMVEFNVNGGRRCTLFLLKDGPPPDIAVASLRREP